MTAIATPAAQAGHRSSAAPLSGFRRAASRALRALAVARMERVLFQFSDRELAAIGIARRDIPAHAKRLAG